MNKHGPNCNLILEEIRCQNNVLKLDYFCQTCTQKAIDELNAELDIPKNLFHHDLKQLMILRLTNTPISNLEWVAFTTTKIEQMFLHGLNLTSIQCLIKCNMKYMKNFTLYQKFQIHLKNFSRNRFSSNKRCFTYWNIEKKSQNFFQYFQELNVRIKLQQKFLIMITKPFFVNEITEPFFVNEIQSMSKFYKN